MKNGLSTYIKVSRRTFLAGLAAVAGGLYLGRRALLPTVIAGQDFSPNHRLGHLLRTGQLLKRTPVEKERSPSVVIVGGGIAGLSAAWWLKRNGFDDFELWELEKEVGGNSRSSTNSVSSFPWGAHYVPLPNDEARYVRLLFEELNVITGYAPSGAPLFNDLYLCSDPQERLLYEGRWHESLIPGVITASERDDVKRFFAEIASFRAQKGKDGKKAFAIPVDLSSQDPELLKLDRITFAQYLDDRGYKSEFLRWYLDYCCRDDYGQDTKRVSAWAGIHYFAGRNARSGNSESQAVLTWPAGNGWLVGELRKKLAPHLKTERVAFRVRNDRSHVLVDSYLPGSDAVERHRPRKVVLAAPRFIASHIVEGRKDDAKDLTYSPWLVANVTLKNLPHGKGAGIAWDNVSYYGRSLGYIVSTHQGLHPFPTKTVITFYLPLDEEQAEAARLKAYHTKLETWQKLVVRELEKMHHGITDGIESIDVCVWGHGMITPTVDFLWGEKRRRLQRPEGNVLFAHSDMSGLSLFEEAQYHGVQAAISILKDLGGGRRA